MTTIDALIDTGLYYGPGILLTAAVFAAGHGFVWAADRAHRLIDDRAARRAIVRQAYLDDQQNRLAARLKAEAKAAPAIDTNPGPIDTTYLQLEGMYAAPDYTHEEG
jgi:hypothetical protein